MSTKNHARELEPKDGWMTDRKHPGEQPELKEIGVINANQATDYQIHEDEEGMYHLAMKKTVNNTKAKRYEDDWHYQTYYPQEYNTMLDSGFFNQYDTVDILHDPTLNSKIARDKNGSKGMTPPINPGTSQNGDVVNPNMNTEPASTQPPVKPPAAYKSLPAAKKKYFELYGIEADENATLDDLNELIASAPAHD